MSSSNCPKLLRNRRSTGAPQETVVRTLFGGDTFNYDHENIQKPPYERFHRTLFTAMGTAILLVKHFALVFSEQLIPLVAQDGSTGDGGTIQCLIVRSAYYFLPAK